MFVELPKYVSSSDKDPRYCQSLYIDNELDLKNVINELMAHNDKYIYRGICDASYKMYTSSQRLWFEDNERMLHLGCKNYYDTIECIIKLTASLPEVQQYIQQNNLPANDFQILAMLQHFASPSPILDFSNNVLKGLLFSVDNMPAWTDNGTNVLEDYVSLYYISRNIDWGQKLKDNADLLYQQVRLEYSNIFFLPIGNNSFYNNTKDIPLVEVVNTVCHTNYFHCINIRKHLAPVIQSVFLQPNGITHDSVYCIDNSVSDQLRTIFDKI